MFNGNSDGSISVDVRGLAGNKKKLQDILAKISKYVEGMHLASRPIERITISKAEYTALLDEAMKGRKVKVGDLKYEGIKVSFAGATK